MKKCITVLLLLCLFLSLTPTVFAASDTFTLMIYLCGTDLESQGGQASTDLSEMLAAGIPNGGNVTVYVQTGGTKTWYTEGITNEKVERWLLSEDGLVLLESVGTADMGTRETFADFLRFGYENCPADRYGLILWDHGSGASGGICSDEMSGDSLFFSEIYAGLYDAYQLPSFQRFSFVGFDACLMASYEMANHLAPYADYMIASEELEPGTGWSYDRWLPALVANPAIDMQTLGKVIVDTFIKGCTEYDSNEYATLSVCNLLQLEPLKAAVEGLASTLNAEIANGNFATLSRIRQNTRSFGEIFDNASDMVDLTLFANSFGRFDPANAAALKDALSQVIVYSQHTNNLTDISGLSILVPFSTREYAPQYMPHYETVTLSPNYAIFANSMLSNLGSGANTNPIGSVEVSQQSIQSATVDWFSQYATDEESYEAAAGSLWDEMYGTEYSQCNDDSFDLDSFLSTLFSESEDTAYNSDYEAGSSSFWGDMVEEGDSTAPNTLSSSSFGQNVNTSEQAAAPSSIAIETENGKVEINNPFANAQGDYAYTAQLTTEQLNSLGSVEANLMMDISDDELECYVELGYVKDVVTDWNSGKICGMFNGTWAALDDQMVCIYDQIANQNYVRSLIPVKLNGAETYLLIIFDTDTPTGRVVGTTEGYTDAGLPARGYTPLVVGDVVVPQYELIYWDDKKEQQSEPFEGDPITVDDSATIPFAYKNVEDDANYVYSFYLTDIFGDGYFTDFISLAF